MKKLMIAIVALLWPAVSVAQDSTALTPKSLEAALSAKPDGPAADQLADRIRTYFGGTELLAKGAPPKTDELMVAWAVEAPQLPPNTPVRVVSDAVLFTLALTKVGSGNLYAGVAPLSHATAFTWHYEAGDRRLGGGQLEVYETHPDSRERPDVPKGVAQADARRGRARSSPARRATGGSTCRRSTSPRARRA